MRTGFTGSQSFSLGSAPGYAPWLVANLHLASLPDGYERCDNVIYRSPSLGYTVARPAGWIPWLRSRILGRRPPAVLTYYRALHEFEPRDGRRELLSRPWGHWRDAVLADLRQARGRP